MTFYRVPFSAIFSAALIIFTALSLSSQDARAEIPTVFQDNKIAVSGADVVAYFTNGRHVKGTNTFTAKHDGAIWQFSSAANRELFKAEPVKYAPQFGGYCAYAVSQGATATTIPEAWSIVDGKLYLNYSLGVKTRWEADKARYISQAKKNWPGVLK